MSGEYEKKKKTQFHERLASATHTCLSHASPPKKVPRKRMRAGDTGAVLPKPASDACVPRSKPAHILCVVTRAGQFVFFVFFCADRTKSNVRSPHALGGGRKHERKEEQGGRG